MSTPVQVSRMVRQHFGNAVLRLMKRPTNLSKDKVVFKVAPSMTKHEIKEYLTKVYGVDVKKVNTMNYEGKSNIFFDVI